MPLINMAAGFTEWAHDAVAAQVADRVIFRGGRMSVHPQSWLHRRWLDIYDRELFRIQKERRKNTKHEQEPKHPELHRPWRDNS